MRTRKTTPADRSGEAPPRAYRLPGFVTDDDVGLGDVVARVTRRIGIKPCGACAKRQAALNRWFVFGGRHK